MNTLSRRQVLALSAATLAVPAFARDDAYPSKPIHVVFPYPPGSPLDALGRVIAEHMARTLGQPVVFDNKPGANGIIGQTQVARATPDGYTLLLTSTSAFLLNSVVRKDLAYDPERSFVPIAPVADIPVALMVNSQVPVSTTAEFIEYARQRPNKLNYGSVGDGSFIHLLMEQFKATTGVNIQHIPFQGASQLATDFLGGRIDVTVLAPLGPWKPEQIKLLAIMSAKRNPAWPNVPAITETLPDFPTFTNWMGFFAPAGTPEPVVKRVSDALNAAVQDQAIRNAVKEQKWSVLSGSEAQFKTLLQADMGAIKRMVASAKIQPS